MVLQVLSKEGAVLTGCMDFLEASCIHTKSLGHHVQSTLCGRQEGTREITGPVRCPPLALLSCLLGLATPVELPSSPTNSSPARSIILISASQGQNRASGRLDHLPKVTHPRSEPAADPCLEIVDRSTRQGWMEGGDLEIFLDQWPWMVWEL